MANRFTGVEVVEWDGQTPLPPVSAPGKSRLVFDTSINVMMLSENGGAYRPISQGGLIQSYTAIPKDPGQYQQFLASGGWFELRNGSGTTARIEARLPRPVLSDSVFVVRVHMGFLYVNNAPPSGRAQLQVRPQLFNPDDPNFPANYYAWDPATINPFSPSVIVGTIAGSGNSFEFEQVVTQEMISARKAADALPVGPTVGRLGFFVECRTYAHDPNDEAACNISKTAGRAGTVQLTIEERAKSDLVVISDAY